MTTKKDLLVAVLLTFCLTVTLFRIFPTSSSPNGGYDPWVDLNDDGTIDLYDAVILSAHAGTTGTPINKTALLYNVNETFTELLSRIGNLSASLFELQARLGNLEGNVESKAGDHLEASADTERETSNLQFTKLKEITCGKQGTFRISFDLKCSGTDTGDKSPTQTGDDFDYYTNPNNAYSNDGQVAEVWTGEGGVGSDKPQDYYDFSFGLPADATIDGIVVKVDVRNTYGGSFYYHAALSWDGGSSYTNLKSVHTSGSFNTYALGGQSDNWGRSWSVPEFSASNFRVKVWGAWIGYTGEGFELDWVGVKVYYRVPAYARIYRNGLAVGTEQSTIQTTYQAYAEDIADWERGDKIQLYVKAGAVGTISSVRNFRIYSNDWNIDID